MWMLGSWFLIIQMSSQGVGLSVCEAWFYCFTKAPCLINQFLERVDAWVMVYDHPKKQWGRGSVSLWGLLLLIYQNSLFYRSMSGRCECLGPGPWWCRWRFRAFSCVTARIACVNLLKLLFDGSIFYKVWIIRSWSMHIQISNQVVKLCVCEGCFCWSIKTPGLINQFLKGVDTWVVVHDQLELARKTTFWPSK